MKLERTPETGTSRVLSNGLELLSLIAKTEGELSLREIGRLLELSPTVTHRLVSTLRKHRFLEKSPTTGKYVIGLESYRVGMSHSRATTIEYVARPILQEAGRLCQVNAFLGVRDGVNIVYLYDFSGDPNRTIRMARGTEIPLAMTAMGIAILSALPDDEIEEIKYNYRSMRESRTHDFTEKMNDRICAARNVGYSQLDSEMFVGVTTIGATVRDARNKVKAAISFGFPSGPEWKTKIPGLASELQKAAREMEYKFSGIQD